MSARGKSFRREDVSAAPEHGGDNPSFVIPRDLLAALRNLTFLLKAWATFHQNQLKDFH